MNECVDDRCGECDCIFGVDSLSIGEYIDDKSVLLWLFAVVWLFVIDDFWLNPLFKLLVNELFCWDCWSPKRPFKLLFVDCVVVLNNDGNGLCRLVVWGDNESFKLFCVGVDRLIELVLV